METDRAGGLFLNGNRSLTADDDCVKIKTIRLPNRDGVMRTSDQELWLSDVVRIPGTDRVIGVGHVAVMQTGNPMHKAVLVSLKRQPALFCMRHAL